MPEGSDFRWDGWANPATGMGDPGMDGSMFSGFSNLTNMEVGRSTQANMYQNDWLCHKLCSKPAADLTRRFIKVEDDSVRKELERLQFRQKVKEAVTWARAFGGAGIVIITEGDDPLEPLDFSKVKRVVGLDVWDRWFLSPAEYDMDPTSQNYLRPEIYQNSYGGQVHTSRVLKFYGAPLTYEAQRANMFWGGSYIQTYFKVLQNFQCTTADARYIISELNIGVLASPNLTQKTAMGSASPAMTNATARLNQMNKLKSNQRMIQIDKQEDFSFTSRNVSGLADLLDRFKEHVCGAFSFPEIILFTKTVGGQNSRDDGQLQIYDDLIGDIQADQARPATETLINCITKGAGADWDFYPLRTMTELQQADIMHKVALAVKEASEVAALTPELARLIMNKTFSGWEFPEDDDVAGSFE